MELIVFFGSFLILLVMRCPVAFSMVLASFGFLLLNGQISLLIIPERMTISLDSFPLLAVPFFVVAGVLMNRAGIARRIFDFALSIFGRFRAGLAHVNVIASMIFAGMSGSAFADAAGLGAVEIKAMVEEGYDRDFSAAVTAASSCIGPVIPPSVVMVLYGVMAEVSIGELFAAGMIPGIIMGLSMMVLIYVLATMGKVNAPRGVKQPLRIVVQKTRAAFFPLLGPVFILGVILLGIATPTEAGVVATVYALVLGLAYRTLSWKSLSEALEESVLTTGRFMFIIAAASVFGWLVTIEQVALVLYQSIQIITTQKWIILLFVNIILLCLGCFIEGIAIMIVSIPALIPLMKAIQVDLVHFGVILTISIMIGLITPPVGMTLYIVSDIAKVRIEDVVRRVIPFLIPLVFTLFLTTYWDKMVLLIPKLLFRH
ncbi:MAG TPA: TRAP transporter large permease [Spirochaetia bacterium]|nr:TRAP transporter large permease [Spirochaetia bacterium]